MTGRDDQRENNNLPKLSEPQHQGRMLVIDEAKAAHELLKIAKVLMADRLPRMDPHEEVYVDTEDEWFSVFGSNSGFCYGQYGSEAQAQRKADELNKTRGF